MRKNINPGWTRDEIPLSPTRVFLYTTIIAYLLYSSIPGAIFFITLFAAVLTGLMLRAFYKNKLFTDSQEERETELIDYAMNLSKKGNMTPDNPLSSSEKQVWDVLESELSQKD